MSPLRGLLAPPVARLLGAAGRVQLLHGFASPSQVPEATKLGTSSRRDLCEVLDIIQGTTTLEPIKARQLKAVVKSPSYPAAFPKETFKVNSIIRPSDFHRDHHRKGKVVLRERWIGSSAFEKDIFHQLDIDPRRECDNAQLLQDYTSTLNRIHNRSVTRLSQRSQRLLGKAIRRAKMMGVIPILSNAKYTNETGNIKKLPPFYRGV